MVASTAEKTNVFVKCTHYQQVYNASESLLIIYSEECALYNTLYEMVIESLLRVLSMEAVRIIWSTCFSWETFGLVKTGLCKFYPKGSWSLLLQTVVKTVKISLLLEIWTKQYRHVSSQYFSIYKNITTIFGSVPLKKKSSGRYFS